ncbi:hypothetical protein LIER_27790 [Lithospermum erythrorhizon]|uniref:Uncharacterized protein n=1 Tax=Lithospermum erythrorhizon TaxID=34254 RepID=A0AAV3RH96_LITER
MARKHWCYWREHYTFEFGGSDYPRVPPGFSPIGIAPVPETMDGQSLSCAGGNAPIQPTAGENQQKP